MNIESVFEIALGYTVVESPAQQLPLRAKRSTKHLVARMAMKLALVSSLLILPHIRISPEPCLSLLAK